MRTDYSTSMRFIAALLLAASLLLPHTANGAERNFEPIAPSVTYSPLQTIDVLDYGVRGDGQHDDAPALRRLFSSDLTGKRVVFPANRRYRIATTVPPADYPAMVPAGVLVSGKRNFAVDARGATFIMAPETAFSAFFLFDRANDWSWQGGRFEASRIGLNSSQENVGVALINVQRFLLTDVTFAGLHGMGAGIAGDWIVDGSLSNIDMDGVGICFDVAFLRRVRISDVSARGDSGRGRPGDKCFSNIFDKAFVHFNRTGERFDDTEEVTVRNLTATNFNTGVAVSSGRFFQFLNNIISSNPGGEGVSGLGYYFYHNLNAAYSSKKHPVGSVLIRGGIVSETGSTSVPGIGVLVSTEDGAGHGQIGNVAIENVQFSCNATASISLRGSSIGIVTRKHNVEKAASTCQ